MSETKARSLHSSSKYAEVDTIDRTGHSSATSFSIVSCPAMMASSQEAGTG